MPRPDQLCDAQRININARVRVRLTGAGFLAYKLHYARLGMEAPALNIGRELETELWDLFHMFGEHMYNGSRELPFQENMIELIGGE